MGSEMCIRDSADFSALRYAQQATRGSDLLSWVDLIADPDDPKDLFSLLTTAP